MKEKGRQPRFFRSGAWIYLTAFLLPVLIMLIFMIAGGAAPFGTRSILLGDANSQSYTFTLELHRKLMNREGLFYAWNQGLGANFYTTIIYYLTSPLTFLAACFPASMLESVLSFEIVIKLGLISLSGTYYFMHSRNFAACVNRRLISLSLGLAYGLSNAVLAYFFFSMWLDIYMMLPACLLALERLLEQGNWKAYYLALAVTIFLNFYMAIPVCIFLCLWFLCQTDFGQLKRNALKFIGASCLAGSTNGILLLPVLYAYRLKYRENYQDVDYLAVHNVWDAFASAFPFNGIDRDDAKMTGFHLFAGSICFLLCVCYLTGGGKKERKSRFKCFLLFAFLISSMCFVALSVLWHGFAIPHGFYNRFAFLYGFLVVYLAGKGLQSLADMTYGRLLIFAGSMAVVFLGALLLPDEVGGAPGYFVFVMLFALFVILTVLYIRRSIAYEVLITLLLVVSLLEMIGNGIYTLTTFEMQDWRADKELLQQSDMLADKTAPNGRMDNDAMQTISNPGTFFGAPAGSAFSSLTNKNIVDFYKKMGLYYFYNGSVYSYCGATPVTDLMMNMSVKLTRYPAFTSSGVMPHTEGYQLFSSPYAVGYGFAAPKRKNRTVCFDNIFQNQNQFVQDMGGEAVFAEVQPALLEARPNMAFMKQTDDNTFAYILTAVSYPKGTPVPSDFDEAKSLKPDTIVLNGGVTLLYELQEDCKDLYLHLRDETGGYAAVYLEGEQIAEWNRVYCNLTVHIGAVQKGQQIKLVCASSGTYQNCLRIAMADFDMEAFAPFLENCAAQSMQCKSRMGGGMTASVDAKQDGCLYTSIPDDGGFTVYVDGEAVEKELLYDCFITVPITAGQHDIEFRYVPPGFFGGGLLTLLSVAAAFAVCRAGNRKKQREWQGEE